MEQVEKVRCINNNNKEEYLTINKEYVLKNADSVYYWLENDINKIDPYLKGRFELVQELPPSVTSTNVTTTFDIKPEHYKMEITPIDFIMKNNIPFIEGNVIKYICRYKQKNGKEDLLKAKQYIDFLLEQYGN